jgi:hypothetical protein
MVFRRAGSTTTQPGAGLSQEGRLTRPEEPGDLSLSSPCFTPNNSRGFTTGAELGGAMGQENKHEVVQGYFRLSLMLLHITLLR